MIYQIVITATARAMLERISDRRVREKIGDAIDALASEPELGENRPVYAQWDNVIALSIASHD